MANNMILGTSEGWSTTMQLIGVGYRAAVSGKTLTLNLGYSNPVVFDIPAGLSCSVRPALRHLLAQHSSCSSTMFPFAGPGVCRRRSAWHVRLRGHCCTSSMPSDVLAWQCQVSTPGQSAGWLCGLAPASGFCRHATCQCQ